MFETFKKPAGDYRPPGPMPKEGESASKESASKESRFKASTMEIVQRFHECCINGSLGPMPFYTFHSCAEILLKRGIIPSEYKDEKIWQTLRDACQTDALENVVQEVDSGVL